MTAVTDASSPTPTGASRAFLELNDLKVHFPTDDGLVKSVDGLSFSLERGRTLGIVGESGSGKSVTSQAILGLHRRSRAKIAGEIWLDGQELLTADDETVRRLRGSKMGMIFQDPLSSLHPFFTIGKQIDEAYRVHHDVDKKTARKRTIEMLDRVGIPNPDKRADDYPHQFSGGMRQRAMIAMSLVCSPELIIADEPTTALDVTVQAQILELMKDIQSEFNSAIIVITHDLGVVAEVADDVLVMYGGKGVERGTVEDIFYRPEMPYTWGLLSSMPRLNQARKVRLEPIPGAPPSLINIPSGCSFHPRCVYRDRVEGDTCRTVVPALEGDGKHLVRCHLDPEVRKEILRTEISTHL